MVIFFELSHSSLILLHLDPSGDTDTNIASFQHHRKRKVFPKDEQQGREIQITLISA
jgi:hypothetical protein